MFILRSNSIKKFTKDKKFQTIKGFIFSGGPSTVTKKNFNQFQKNFYQKNTMLGNLLWLQLIAKLFGGKIKSSKKEEFGRAVLSLKKKNLLLTKNFF